RIEPFVLGPRLEIAAGESQARVGEPGRRAQESFGEGELERDFAQLGEAPVLDELRADRAESTAVSCPPVLPVLLVVEGNDSLPRAGHDRIDVGHVVPAELAVGAVTNEGFPARSEEIENSAGAIPHLSAF